MQYHRRMDKITMSEQEGSRAGPAPAPGTARGELAWVTLPTDDVRIGQPWADALRDAGHQVHDLGVLAPAVGANKAIAMEADALMLVVDRRSVRRGVQTLVAHLQHLGASLPVLLAGPGVDADFARWVAVPQGGVPYWGGVYYCADRGEAVEVLRQIVLFEPPPMAHSHDDATASDDGCESCSACPISTACELEEKLSGGH